MQVTRVVAIECDKCGTEERVGPAFDEYQSGWFVGLYGGGSRRTERTVCPRCMADVIDPAEDIGAEMRRIELEDQIGAAS